MWYDVIRNLGVAPNHSLFWRDFRRPQLQCSLLSVQLVGVSCHKKTHWNQQGPLYYQPKECIHHREITWKYHTFKDQVRSHTHNYMGIFVRDPWFVKRSATPHRASDSSPRRCGKDHLWKLWIFHVLNFQGTGGENWENARLRNLFI